MSRTRILKGVGATAVVTSLLLGAIGCGGNDATASSNGLTEITVGILPTVDLAPLQYAIDQGYFADHGLKVKTRVTSGGSEAIPSLMAGDVDFIFTSYIPVLLARQSGLDVVIASGSHSNTPGENSPSGLWTLDPSIKTLADLKGKTIAVNALGSIGELLIDSAMDDAGVAKDDFKMIEVPFPEVPAALDQKRVDAAWVAEPSRSTIKAETGAHFVGSSKDPKVLSTSADLTNDPMAGYAARGNEDAKVLEEFHDAMAESLDKLSADPDIARKVAPEVTDIDKSLLPNLALSTYGEVSADDLERLQNLMLKYGMLKKSLGSLGDLVYTPKS